MKRKRVRCRAKAEITCDFRPRKAGEEFATSRTQADLLAEADLVEILGEVELEAAEATPPETTETADAPAAKRPRGRPRK